jgi:hypothetical protein
VSPDATGDAPRDTAADRAETGSPPDGGDAGVCGNYCATMQATCASYTGYPFATAGSCDTACNAFTAPERACWTYFANLARDMTSNREHNCQHAWGDHDLDECP